MRSCPNDIGVSSFKNSLNIVGTIQVVGNTYRTACKPLRKFWNILPFIAHPRVKYIFQGIVRAVYYRYGYVVDDNFLFKGVPCAVEPGNLPKVGGFPHRKGIVCRPWCDQVNLIPAGCARLDDRILPGNDSVAFSGVCVFGHQRFRDRFYFF